MRLSHASQGCKYPKIHTQIGRGKVWVGGEGRKGRDAIPLSQKSIINSIFLKEEKD